MRQAEKERKEFQTEFPLILDPGEKIQRKIAKKFNKLKNNFPALFLAQPIPLILDPGEKIPKKIAKKFNKLKK